MKRYKYSWLLIFALICMVACKEEEEPIPVAPTLEITDSNVKASYTQADINLQIETKATIQDMVAEYSTDTAFGTFSQTKMSVTVDTKTDITRCNVTIHHLTDHTKYYLRCRAINKQGSIVSKPILFETKACELAQVHADSITDITISSALLHATLVHWGSDTLPVVGFCYGNHQNVTVEDNLILCVVKEKDTVSFSAPLEKLEDNKTYYFRAYAVNCKGVAYSEEMSFTTTEIILPSLSEVTISDITYTTAKAASEVKTDGGSAVLARGICYSTQPNPTIESARITCGNGEGAFNGVLTNLEDGKKYYVRAYAENVKGVAYSEEAVFTTDAYGVPTVSTSEPSNISYTTATIGGEVKADGGKTVTERGVCYSTLPNPMIASSKMKKGSGLGSFTCNLTELTNGTTYYVRAYATNEQGTSYGEEKTFTTTDYGVPTVETTAVTNITYTSATAGGKVSADGGAIVTERGVCYSIEHNPTVLNNVVAASYGGLGSYTCALPDLTDGTTYYVRAYAKNVKGIVYGEETSFTTAAYGQPIVTTADITNITYTTAKAGGNVTADGGKEVTERGICYAVNKTPTLADNQVIGGKGIGSFTCELTGLVAGTTYNVRAYATNSVGTTYGEMKTFTTTDYSLPTVTTASVTDISYTTATAGGNVTADGGQEVTEKGVCFSTSSNPTIDNTKVAYNVGGMGSYTCQLADLTQGTTYYLRAYATNSKGTAYGSEHTFTTKKYELPEVTTTSAEYISFYTAICSGKVTNDNGVTVTERGICYSTEHNPTVDDLKVASGSGTGTFQCGLVDLSDNTTYYYRAYATNSWGTGYGEEKSFTTLDIAAATIYYTADHKLAESSSNPMWDGGCINVHEFESALDSHTFENGVGTMRFTNPITRIYYRTFYYCEALKTVTLPYSVKYIDDGAFIRCNGLQSFEIPENVRPHDPSSSYNVGFNIFIEGCTSLAAIHVAENNQHFCDVDGVLFSKDKSKLYLYPDAKSSETYTIPSGVTEIQYHAFEDCKQLKSVFIPEGVVKICFDAFKECENLISMTIPNSVTKIGSDAFYNCKSMTTLVLGSGLTSIGDEAFRGCSAITAITCHALVPPECGNFVFSEVVESIPLYVPAASVNAYKNADIWKIFTNIQAIP